RWTFRTEGRHFSVAKVCAGKSLRSLGLGEEKVTGGLKQRGHARSGTSRQQRYAPRHKRNPAVAAKTRPRCIAFIRTCGRSAGLWKESTIEVRRAPLRFSIQFSRRCFAPRRPGFSREGAGTTRDCVGGPRRCLRCSTIPHGGKVGRDSTSRRRRD